ncbi:MAG: hypothetical protein Q4E21_05890, partial [Clostridia bacterium]|nr:hypothetical protein [Clostridia bacterium]
VFLLVFPLCREVYEFSENICHLRDGRKTLHRSVFLFRPFESLADLKRKKHGTPFGVPCFWRAARVFLLVFPLCREVYEFSENICHLRDGRKTLHRSVSSFALSNPCRFKTKKHGTPFGVPCFWRAARDSNP